MFIRGLRLPLHLNLRGQSGVENELLEIPFIDQVLKVSEEDSRVHCEVASPFVEDIIVSRSRPFRVR